MIVISRRHEEEIYFSCNGVRATVRILKPGNRFRFVLPKGVTTQNRGSDIVFKLAGAEISLQVLHSNPRRTRLGIFCPEEVKVIRGPSIPGESDGRQSRPECGDSGRSYPAQSFG